TLGFVAQREPNAPWTVAAVETDGLAARAGLQVGDEILRWNNGEVPRRPERWVGQQKPGDALRLRVKRGDKQEAIEVRLGGVRERFYQVAEMQGADERARRGWGGLFKGKTKPVTRPQHPTQRFFYAGP